MSLFLANDTVAVYHVRWPPTPRSVKKINFHTTGNRKHFQFTQIYTANIITTIYRKQSQNDVRPFSRRIDHIRVGFLAILLTRRN